MSLAVGQQTLRPRETAVEQHPESESSISHACEAFNSDPAPSSHARPTAGEHDFSPSTTCTPAVQTPSDLCSNNHHRDSYDSIQRQYYEAMVDMDLMASKAEAVVGEQQDQSTVDGSETTTTTTTQTTTTTTTSPTAPPVLPQKSALRASRLLDGLVGLKVAVSTPNFTTQTTTPLDEYLSSEEEASSTAGDFSDLDEYDSSSDDISPSPVKESTAQEVTARVVSVIFSGKPVVVNVPQARRSISPHSIERPKSANELGSDRRSVSPCESEIKSRRTSVSTMSSRMSRSTSATTTNLTTTTTTTTETKSQLLHHPPRSSSMQPLTSSKSKPFFLKIDPYANGSTYSLDNASKTSLPQTLQAPPPPRQEKPQQDEQDEKQTEMMTTTTTTTTTTTPPKTPTRMFKGVARAMSLMKRRSMPRLNQAQFASSSNEHLSFPRSPSNGSIPEEPQEDATSAEKQAVVSPPPPSQPQHQQNSQPTEYNKTTPVVVEPKTTTTSAPPQPTRPPPQPLIQQQPPLTHDSIVRMAALNERKQQQQQQQQRAAGVRTLHEGQGLQTPQPIDSPVSPMSPMSAISAHSTQSSSGGKRMSSFGFSRRRMSVKLTGGKFQL